MPCSRSVKPTRLRFTALVATCLSVVLACGGDQVELVISCGNPDLVYQEDIWETMDVIPNEWRSLDTVNGTFSVESDGQHGTFTGPEGVTLAYQLVTDEFRSHPCLL